MSDNATQTAEATAEATVDASVDTSVESTVDTQVEATATEQAATSKTEQKKDPYAKFRDADGNIDTEKMGESYQRLEKAYSMWKRPATSVEEYSYDFGEGFQVDEQRTNAFKEEALAKGMSAGQYAWLMEKYASNMKEFGAAMAQSTWTEERATQQLVEVWGVSDGAEFKENMASAQRAFAQYAADADPTDSIWNHPDVVKAFARMGQEMSEDVVKTKVATTSGESVQQKIDALRNEPDYMSNPAKQKQMLKLYEQLG